jgi:hypothetical protein
MHEFPTALILFALVADAFGAASSHILLRFDFRLQRPIFCRLEPGFRCVERILQCTVHRRIRPSVQSFSRCVALPANLPPRPAATVRSAVKGDVCLLGSSGFSNQVEAKPCSETGRCPRRRVASPAVFPKMIRVEGGLQHSGAHARELKNTRGPSNTRARARGTPKCTRARAHAYTHTRTHAHARAHARLRAHTRTHARARMTLAFDCRATATPNGSMTNEF